VDSFESYDCTKHSRFTGSFLIPHSVLSGVNYFFAVTTTISPDQRQLLCNW
jgi:hypothetical protein